LSRKVFVFQKAEPLHRDAETRRTATVEQKT
jgi:HPt (histidine-containing phosphotransfer) domain-containing protein